MLCALIMAGGKGTRFWPLSTEEKPKQFLSLLDERSMIQMTVDRVKPLIPSERIFVCTGKDYVDLVKEQLPELPQENIIIEPQSRNTAPCIALSSFVISKRYSESTIVVLASDHLVGEEDKFRECILKGKEFLSDFPEAIVTLGIKPTRVETQYGYIKLSNDLAYNGIDRVEAFVEKPNETSAKDYVESNKYLWNSGMFIWKTKSILNKFKNYLPNTFDVLEEVNRIDSNELEEFLKNNYKKTDAISVDYGILEKDNNIYVINCSFKWDDVGSWNAIERFSRKDINSNIYIGDVKGINVEDNIIILSESEVIISDIKGIYVIESQGKIYIGKKENLQRVGELKDI